MDGRLCATLVGGEGYTTQPSTTLRLRLPGTSANLGPGFDALGLALNLYLTIEAKSAAEFSIHAAGRNREQVASLNRNLILDTYRDLAEPNSPRLSLSIQNQIPLGMGLGSSAAAILAGVFLANHFAALQLTPQQILEEACRREGHPDNVAACFHGGMTISAMQGREVVTTTVGHMLDWHLLVAVPSISLPTEKARALLPPAYTRADAVANIQSTALLVAAFTANRPDLLHAAMRDRLHQPYRLEACPLLARLLPLSGTPGIFGVALSGAGPSVLLITDGRPPDAAIREAAGDPDLELLHTTIALGAEII